MNAVEYDQSGQWPITPDGWQLVPLGRDLFPGGPSAVRVCSPVGSFFFGISFEPLRGEPCRAVITSFGRSTNRSDYRYVLTEPQAMAVAQGRVRDLLLEHPLKFHYRRFDAVEFRGGDGRIVEIF